MRHRGTGYWLWTNTRLPFQTYEEVLDDGVQVEVRARKGATAAGHRSTGLCAAGLLELPQVNERRRASIVSIRSS